MAQNGLPLRRYDTPATLLQWAEHVDRYSAVIGPWVLHELWGEEDEDKEDESEEDVSRI
jgi:hypothetical protein